MILFQIGLGILLSALFVALAQQFASAFVPVESRATSLTYVRISSLSALSPSMKVVVACCTRVLNRPNVPLLISSVKFVVDMLLDFVFISKFHVISAKPTVASQTLIRMTCDLTSALCGLLYFLYISIKRRPMNWMKKHVQNGNVWRFRYVRPFTPYLNQLFEMVSICGWSATLYPWVLTTLSFKCL